MVSSWLWPGLVPKPVIKCQRSGHLVTSPSLWLLQVAWPEHSCAPA